MELYQKSIWCNHIKIEHTQLHMIGKPRKPYMVSTYNYDKNNTYYNTYMIRLYDKKIMIRLLYRIYRNVQLNIQLHNSIW